MRIVVLVKPVPDTTGAERLGDDLRLDRASGPAIVNPNDEHAVEQALRLIEAHGGDITLLTMAPPAGAETMRRALAMGADRGLLVSDRALGGACALGTAKVLAAALATLPFDLVLAGAASADGAGGVVASAIATYRGLPYLSHAAGVEVDEGHVRVRRLEADGHAILEAPLPALVTVTQMVGEPRYATLKGIMGARAKEIRTIDLDALALDPAAVAGAGARTRVLWARPPTPRPPTRVVDGTPEEGAAAIVDLLATRGFI